VLDKSVSSRRLRDSKLTIRTSSFWNRNLLVNGASISSTEVARAVRGTVVVMVEMKDCGNFCH
jgi:hypothetical protein